ncbi:hypothetical protein B0T21DRAFT_351982 [Apiosordaria backusii]|uniref:Uncharacterized protein n=1 Tax=Apiosordaria backusii TaxID=314023 RepID=A0AA40DXC5_9PEZI|nr:hypothetical protein B0T21DRAFT_351982 [Apiosordaria backusii]
MATLTPPTPSLSPEDDDFVVKKADQPATLQSATYHAHAKTPSRKQPSATTDHITWGIATPRSSPHRQTVGQLKGVLKSTRTPNPWQRRLWASQFYFHNPKSLYTGPNHKRGSVRISTDPPTCLVTRTVYELRGNTREDWYAKVKKEIRLRKNQASGDKMELDDKHLTQEVDGDTDSQASDEDEATLNGLLALAASNLKLNMAEEARGVKTRSMMRRCKARNAEERRLAKKGTRSAKKAIEELRSAPSAREQRATARSTRRE